METIRGHHRVGRGPNQTHTEFEPDRKGGRGPSEPSNTDDRRRLSGGLEDGRRVIIDPRLKESASRGPL